MRENIKELVRQTGEKADAFLICSPVNRRYVTNFETSDGFVVIKDGKITFITDFRYIEAAQTAQKNGIIDQSIRITEQQRSPLEQISEIIGKDKKVLFEDAYVSVKELTTFRKFMPTANFYSGSHLISTLRARKDEYELENIKKAQSITDKAFTHILTVLSDNAGKPGFTEKDVSLELEFFMRKNGSEGVAFDTISVSGHKSSLPHGVPENIPLQKGFLTMDFGARYGGYCSDMTRTVCIGKADEEMKRVYDTVLKAQKCALEQISGGIAGNVADGFARSVIDGAGYKGTFGHSLGHSLGLEIHERPCFSPSDKTAVPSGAVVSVEPGIYIPGKYGVRIEDIVYLTDDGCTDLTHSHKTFTEI